MKILKLTELRIEPAIAQTYKSRKNGALYYNIVHGTNGGRRNNLHAYILTLDRVKFTPEKEGDTLVLDGDNYTLNLILDKQGCAFKDYNGNNRYTIATDYMTGHRDDCIVLWEIPTADYKKVTYSINGAATEIAKGTTGRVRGSTSTIIPAPIVEVIGNTILEWEGINTNGEKYIQTITYSNNAWNLTAVTKKDS